MVDETSHTSTDLDRQVSWKFLNRKGGSLLALSFLQIVMHTMHHFARMHFRTFFLGVRPHFLARDVLLALSLNTESCAMQRFSRVKLLTQQSDLFHLAPQLLKGRGQRSKGPWQRPRLLGHVSK